MPLTYTLGDAPLTVNSAYSPSTYPSAFIPETEYPLAEDTLTVYLTGS